MESASGLWYCCYPLHQYCVITAGPGINHKVIVHCICHWIDLQCLARHGLLNVSCCGLWLLSAVWIIESQHNLGWKAPLEDTWSNLHSKQGLSASYFSGVGGFFCSTVCFFVCGLFVCLFFSLFYFVFVYLFVFL